MNLKRMIFAACIALVFCTAGCYNDIYNMISGEVALEANGIRGDTNSIVRFKEHIYLSNGNFYYKTAASSNSTHEYNQQWKKGNIPQLAAADSSPDFPGVPDGLHFLASDENYLYALMISWHETNLGYQEPYSRTLWYTDKEEPAAGDWKQIDLSDIIGEKPDPDSIKIIFDNQYVKVEEGANDAGDYDLSNRHAFVRLYNEEDKEEHVYRLNGGGAPERVDGNNAGANTCTAVWFKGEDYFSEYYAFAAGEKYIYYAQSKTEVTTSGSNKYPHASSGSTTLYYADEWNGEKFILGSDDSARAVALDAGSIYSIAVAQNYLLLGTSSGLSHTSLNDGVPNDKKSSFNSNGNSIISSYVFKVFTLNPSGYEDSTDTEKGTDCYACSTILGSISNSSDTFNKTGLFAYYPGRGTWNRDGTADAKSNGN